MRVLTGEIIYDGDGNALVTSAAQVDPTAVVQRFVRLYDHNDTADATAYGSDSIAGGAGSDVIFGQMGNDDIQGDGSVIDIEGRVTVNARVTRVSVEDLAGAGTDGDDYIEGNGGNDLIFGNLGQDDLIGDNSDQFSLIAPAMRPAGSDTIFGGAGTRLVRNDIGAEPDDCDVTVDGQSRDADVILGDNGNIYRLVGTNGQPGTPAAFLSFNYDDSAAGHKIIPRAFVLLDYTQGVRGANDRGTDDLLHGEAGNDTIHGMTGNDVAFGEGQDDDIYGGSGYDRLYGGTGTDGILGDDGKIRTSRNGLIESLNNVFEVSDQTLLTIPGPFVGAVVNITGEIQKTVDLAAFELGSADVIYGGLGCDFLHGGAGDDAISGAEAEREFYTEAPQTQAALGYDPANPLGYDPLSRKLAEYNAEEPRTKIENFLLNFDTYRIDESTGALIQVAGESIKNHDGSDRIFGDTGNDWLVGGTGADRMFGGRGDDYLNADDNMDTNGGLNDGPDATLFADADFAYGGAGLDVLMANTGGDRLFDWTGEFNSFIVPFSAFGAPTVNRLLSPHVKAFIQALGTGEGADPTIFEPNGELGLVDQDDPDWNDQHGGPRDPQPGNIGGVHRDTQGAPEDMDSPPDCGCDFNIPVIAGVSIVKAVNGEDANVGSGPLIAVGSTVTWTYQVRNTGDLTLTNVRLVDDAGTSANTADDFEPVAVTVVVGDTTFNVGDVDRDNQLDANEIWLYTATGKAMAGAYVNLAQVTALDLAGVQHSDIDPAHYYGYGSVTASIRIENAINASDPTRPTVAEDADAAPGPTLQVDTPITWTYLVFNDGADAIRINSIRDNGGTAGSSTAADDFTPTPVLNAGFNVGDTNLDNLLDPGEVWRFTSAGTGTYLAGVGAHKNVVTVKGTINGTSLTVQDDDPVNYFGSRTSSVVDVKIEKAVNAVNPNAPTAYEDADFATGPVVPVGSTVVWTYQLFNTGNVATSVQSLRDDAGTPDNLGDDFTPAAVLSAGFNVGDIDRDNLLDVSEVWLYRATGTAGAGQYTNQATITVIDQISRATATSTDVANHFGSAAGVQVVKAVNAVNPAAPTTAEDANNPAAPVNVAAGSTVVFSYAVTTTTNDSLRNVNLIDDAGTIGFTGDDFVPSAVLAVGTSNNVGDVNHNNLLDKGETWLYSATLLIADGAYTNYATVSAVNNRTSAAVRDDDPANVFGALTPDRCREGYQCHRFRQPDSGRR
jgi:uncharacterized repeat protein (TIGR01451 family)